MPDPTRLTPSTPHRTSTPSGKPLGPWYQCRTCAPTRHVFYMARDGQGSIAKGTPNCPRCGQRAWSLR